MFPILLCTEYILLLPRISRAASADDYQAASKLHHSLSHSLLRLYKSIVGFVEPYQLLRVHVREYHLGSRWDIAYLRHTGVEQSGVVFLPRLTHPMQVLCQHGLRRLLMAQEDQSALQQGEHILYTNVWRPALLAGSQFSVDDVPCAWKIGVEAGIITTIRSNKDAVIAI